MLSENDISILIPVWHPNAELFACTVQSALATGAGEILISCDDARQEDIRLIESFVHQDERVRFFRQPGKLGLWENHQFLIERSTKSWVKFIQHDDCLEPNGLQMLCQYAGQGVAIVSSLPSYKCHPDGLRYVGFTLDSPVRWTSVNYLARLEFVGNELGPPSCSLVRSELLRSLPIAWSSDRSCDYLMNVGLAARGDVVILPPGVVTIGVHSERDGSTQSLNLAYERLGNTVSCLKGNEGLGLRAVGRVFAAIEYMGFLRMALGSWRRKRNLRTLVLFFDAIPRAVANILSAIMHGSRISMSRGFSVKYRPRQGQPLPFLDETGAIKAQKS